MANLVKSALMVTSSSSPVMFVNWWYRTADAGLFPVWMYTHVMIYVRGIS